MKKLVYIIAVLAALLTAAALSSCNTSGPVETLPENTSGTANKETVVTTRYDDTAAETSAVTTGEASESTTSGGTTAESTATETTTKKEKDFLPLTLEESSPNFLNGVNPGYDEATGAFACYFTDTYIYWFETSDKCTFTVTCGDEVLTPEAQIDLTVNGGNVCEEGIFCGVGIKTAFPFEAGKNYRVAVKIETLKYIYGFEFDFTKEAG